MAVGRPSAYDTIIKPNMDKIKAFRAKGMTYKQIADSLNIAVSVLYKYKAEIAELNDLFKKSIEERAGRLEKSALNVALGGIKTTKTKKQLINGKLQVVEIVEEETLPNVTMLIFLLKSYRPEVYNSQTPPLPNEEQDKDMDEYEK